MVSIDLPILDVDDYCLSRNAAAVSLLPVLFPSPSVRNR